MLSRPHSAWAPLLASPPQPRGDSRRQSQRRSRHRVVADRDRHAPFAEPFGLVHEQGSCCSVSISNRGIRLVPWFSTGCHVGSGRHRRGQDEVRYEFGDQSRIPSSLLDAPLEPRPGVRAEPNRVLRGRAAAWDARSTATGLLDGAHHREDAGVEPAERPRIAAEAARPRRVPQARAAPQMPPLPPRRRGRLSPTATDPHMSAPGSSRGSAIEPYGRQHKSGRRLRRSCGWWSSRG